MSPLALAFMIGSWSFVLGLSAWCFHRVLRAGRPRVSGDATDDTGESTGDTVAGGAP